MNFQANTQFKGSQFLLLFLPLLCRKVSFISFHQGLTGNIAAQSKPAQDSGSGYISGLHSASILIG